MKVLFVIRSTRTFHYHRSIIASLLRRGHSVHALFDYEWSRTKIGAQDIIEKFCSEYPDFKYSWAISRRDLWSKILFPLRELRSFRSYLNRPEQSLYYKERSRRYLSWKLRFLTLHFPVLEFFLKMGLSERLLGWVENMTPPDRKIVQDIRRIAPQVVLASPVNLRYSSADLEYLKAAVWLRIPSAVQIISWDNLTTKGLIHIIPDKVLVWNKVQAEEASSYHKIPVESIEITGAPVFDEWFEEFNPSLSREEFCKRFSLRLEDPFLVYLGSTENIAENETWLVRDLRDALNRATDFDLRRVQIVVRPHPGHAKIYNVLVSCPGISIVPPEGSLPATRERLELFYDTLYHSIGTVGINTTGMIDAIIVGKPGIAMLTPQYSRTQAEAQHFQHLLAGDALERARNPEEFLGAVRRFLDNSEDRGSKRISFVEKFVRPLGMNHPAGEAVAQAIEDLWRSKQSSD